MEDNTMQQDERSTKVNTDLRLKIIIKNKSEYDFDVYYKLKSGEFCKSENFRPYDNKEADGNEVDRNAPDSNEYEYCATLLRQRDSMILFGQKKGCGPQGQLLFFTDTLLGNRRFKLYFDLSILPTNPRCTYIYPLGDYPMVSPICCFPTEGDANTYTVEYTISDTEECKNFYHVTDTHFSDGFDDEEQAKRANYAHKSLFDRINNDDLAFGLIHTGDICDWDEHFKQYCNYYLKAANVRDDFRPKYLKNLYEGYGNHDRSDVIKHIKKRHESFQKNDSPDQGVYEECASNGLHYLWKWRGVYFIHLNLAPIDGKDTDGLDGNEALTYLKNVLNKLYTQWGVLKPVILCFHYLISVKYGKHDFLSDQQKKDFWDVIKDHNICAILCGHEHGYYNPFNLSFKYNEEYYDIEIPCYCAGPMKPCDYGDEVYKSTYYRFTFEDDKQIITPYKNEIIFRKGTPPDTFENYEPVKINIAEGKKPACHISPNPPEMED